MEPARELLFAYGSLRDAQVQLDTFGRTATGTPDVLPGYRSGYGEVRDRDAVNHADLSRYALVRETGDARDKVIGVVLEVSEAELDAADEYEMSLYRRVPVVLASGRHAWVYVADH